MSLRLLTALAVLLFSSAMLLAETPASKLEDLRARALELVNADRAAHGLAALEPDGSLNVAAQAHAEDMRQRDYFAHISPEGGTVMDRTMAAGGSRAVAVAENIGACGPCPPDDVLQSLQRGWMDSPSHRANILDPGLERFGFGAAGDAARFIAVQTFAGPGTAPPGVAVTPADADPLDAEAQAARAAELINQHRAEAGAPPLAAAPALSEALAAQVPEEMLERFSLDTVSVPTTAGPWSRVFLVGGRCGGCGTAVTAADVRFFVKQWLGIPAYRDALLDPAVSHLGLTISADGSGAKVALAAVAGE
ncbi:CAP domain-containing protein [Novispirillum sp. DQ9]|uniref:CAP domain-containing protein n=1 Tax=Novispirillum sp. DQ9 TaxID=3398612 RepID=UPI003C7C6CDB